MSSNFPDKSPVDLLATPVQYVRGIGPRRADLFEKLGLRFARDLVFFFPRDYEDLTDRRELQDLEEGKLQTVLGVIDDVELRSAGTGRCILGVLIRCNTGYLRAIWFNQPFMRDRFAAGQRVVVGGKPKRDGLMWQMVHPRVTHLAEDEEEPPGAILPVYPLTEGIQQWQVRRVLRDVLDEYAPLLDEVFPLTFLEDHDLWPLRKSLSEVHFPSSAESLEKARRRFVYQELFILQLGLVMRRCQLQASQKAPALEATAKIDARIQQLFPFQLTPGQKQAIREISADMGRAVPMNRLLQGDVGSGKTIVAVYAMLLAAAHGQQAVLMVPTEILARQHDATLNRLLATSQVRRALLVGGLGARERDETLLRIAAGQVDLIVGTQAILQDDVVFRNLGLVVIDEQHKFGVQQRATLRHAGPDPHYLVMTATPIPRTVTMTLFGDLDVSTLCDMPPGRQKVSTYLVHEDERARWWEFFGKKLREGRQGYVIVPLVEDSEQIEAASLEAAYEELANGPLEAFRLGVVHGRMSAEEKDAVMTDFRSGEIQALVATSVVEVGVDVPNATLMTIEAGERFGLSQLHQLRGRIARSMYAGFCAVFADSKTDEAQKRLDAFVGTSDGFQLAEADFAIRGPGELFGTRQHGIPPFRVADLIRDAEVVGEARRDAQAMVAADPGLALPEHARLRRMMLVRYGQALELADVG
jgi:ATP-dependent DNA helicase RecG